MLLKVKGGPKCTESSHSLRFHREVVASRQLSPELKEVLTEVVGNFIKTRPLKARLFFALCEEMGADHTSGLFHSEARCLSCVFELRAEIGMFLEEERMYEAASKFSDEKILLKLAYLSNVFGKLNELNLQIQGRQVPTSPEVAETTDSGATTVTSHVLSSTSLP